MGGVGVWSGVWGSSFLIKKIWPNPGHADIKCFWVISEGMHGWSWQKFPPRPGLYVD